MCVGVESGCQWECEHMYELEWEDEQYYSVKSLLCDNTRFHPMI